MHDLTNLENTIIRIVDEHIARKGWSDEQFCQRAHMDLTSLKALRRTPATMSMVALTRMARALDLDPGQLLQRAEREYWQMR